MFVIAPLNQSVRPVPSGRPLNHALQDWSASRRKFNPRLYPQNDREVPGADLSRCSNIRCRNLDYSITSSAMLSNVGGTVMPSILAVWALMTSSNLVDCTTGRSAGFAPLRMRPV